MKVMMWCRQTIIGVVLLGTALAATAALAQSRFATASSEWGPGYGADRAADGVSAVNSNYWQTRQGQDKGAWWQQDLGRVVTVRDVKIAWARYEDKVHCPPAVAVVQVSLTGAEGTWKDVPKDRPFGVASRWETVRRESRVALPASGEDRGPLCAIAFSPGRPTRGPVSGIPLPRRSGSGSPLPAIADRDH